MTLTKIFTLQAISSHGTESFVLSTCPERTLKYLLVNACHKDLSTTYLQGSIKPNASFKSKMYNLPLR